ncbi:MAG: type IV pilus assembly protein PilV [Candidatus Azotimanducaceae bacterium]|jgi:type IV pilus assembly protein PilV
MKKESLHTRIPQLAKRNSGFSMMELLVAVLVMGVGVLGVTGMQLVSLQNNRDALLRSEAVQLAYDILDRVRVNPGAGVAGTNYDGVNLDDDPPIATDCVANVCTTAQMVAFDVASWKCSLGGFATNATCTDFRTADVLPDVALQPGLPNGDGSIAVDGGGVITVTVRWNGFNNQLQTISIESQG